MKHRVLYLEDDAVSVELSRRMMERANLEAELQVVSDRDSFLRECSTGNYDLVLSDHDVPGFSGMSALREVRERAGRVPFVFVCSVGGKERELECMDAGADGFVQKDQLWRLPSIARGLIRTRQTQHQQDAVAHQKWAMTRLVTAVKDLSRARTMDDIARIVRTAARELNGADGATFVLRDGEQCYYFDEDAIEPLWKGSRFPMEACVSGWAMRNGKHVAIEDIYQDARVPADAYRPTFVKSLVMVPVRSEAPVAAIGNYWARTHRPTAAEIENIQALADSTSIAMENVEVYAELEKRVRDRTAALEMANQDLQAYSYSVSHDLRTPVGQVIGFAELLREDMVSAPAEDKQYIDYILTAATRMNGLIEDLLQMGRVARADMIKSPVDLNAMAREIITGISQREPARRVQWHVSTDLNVVGDPQLLRVVLENLLSNAFKYSGKQPDAVVEIAGLVPKDGFRTFYVRDNGAGFDPKQAGRLFTPFVRLHSPKDFVGTGVGLATCQRIIHRHGGRIWAEADVGQGATFFFSLPVA